MAARSATLLVAGNTDKPAGKTRGGKVLHMTELHPALMLYLESKVQKPQKVAK